MKKFVKKSIATSIAFTVLCSTALAAEVPYSVEYDYTTNAITIGGTADETATYAALQILEKDKSFDDVAADPTNSELVLYRYQKKIADGGFSFTMEYDIASTGSYAARLVTDNGDMSEFNVLLVNGEEYKTTLDELKGYADSDAFDDFKNCISTKNEALGFDITLCSELKDTKALMPYMSYIKTQTLDPDKSDDIIKDFNSFVLMAALEESKVSNISDYLYNTSLTDTDAAVDYISLADTKSKQEYITDKVSGKAIENFDDFEEALKEALVLGEVRYASGYGGVKSILAKYGSVIGIEDTASTDVYKKLSGQDYDDGEDLLRAYKALKKESSSSSNKGGSSGGGGGGGSKMPTYMNAEYPAEAQTEAPEKIYVYFHDIDGVEWATEAILALADMKIINGKSEGFFKPNDFITREEFAKIIVCALGYQDEKYSGNVFADADDDDWFAPYINIAYSKGLVKGIGDGKFGVGEMISRQDMMVILYNALEKSGAELPDGELTFEDSNMIADYATDAVAALYEMGIINGVSETMFDPLAGATRAQAAKVVYGFLQQLQ